MSSKHPSRPELASIKPWGSGINESKSKSSCTSESSFDYKAPETGSICASHIPWQSCAHNQKLTNLLGILAVIADRTHLAVFADRKHLTVLLLSDRDIANPRNRQFRFNLQVIELQLGTHEGRGC